MFDFAFTEGHPVLIYDSSYPSIAAIACDAKDKGYDIHIFAPGFPESATCNLLDLLKDSADTVAAHQLAVVICKIGLLASSNLDSFFAPSSIGLIQAVLMLTKEFELADLKTADAILGSEYLTERLMAADLNPWLQVAFGQLFSTVGTKTNASIITAASVILEKFIAAQPTDQCFFGKTTFPLEIKDKQLIVLGFNPRHQQILAPLMPSILHIIITHNAINQYFHPFVFTADEFPFSSFPKDICIPIIKNSPQINEFNHKVWGKFTADIIRQKNQHRLAQVNLDVRKLEIERNLPIPEFAN
jgi:type IV secretory pathway TraG/TraD family ATPase VirD4